MEIIKSHEWTTEGLRFQGSSSAGIGTCIGLPELGICLDVATGPHFAVKYPNYLITHGHMDHAAGIPYLVSQKALHNLPKGRFFMPKELADPMKRIMAEWSQIEGHEYDFEFVGIELEKKFSLTPNLFFKPFKTHHRVPCCGYTIFGEKKRLKAEYQNLKKQDFIKLKNKGVEIEERIEQPLVSFTGDTKIEFLDGPEWVRNSKVLIMEATYYSDKKNIESAREWGHTHIEELLKRIHELKCEKLILIHQSRRHSTQEVQSILNKKLPKEWKDKVLVGPTVSQKA